MKPTAMTATRVRSGVLGISIAAACLILLTGCGNSTHDPGRDPGRDGVKEVLVTFATAVKDHDAARACSLLDPAMQRAVETSNHTSDCLAALKTWSTTRPALDTSNPSITISDGIAHATLQPTADAKPFTRNGTWTLTRDADRWGISTPR